MSVTFHLHGANTLRVKLTDICARSARNSPSDAYGATMEEHSAMDLANCGLPKERQRAATIEISTAV